MGISGDISKLGALRKRLGDVVQLAAKVAPVVAPLFKGFVAEGFARKTDPYGGAWKAITAATRKRGTKSALDRSGRMKGEIDYLPFGTRVKVWLGTAYARFHISTGRRTLPRPKDLPARWGQAIEVEAEKQFKATTGGGSV